MVCMIWVAMGYLSLFNGGGEWALCFHFAVPCPHFSFVFLRFPFFLFLLAPL